MQLNRKFVLNM